MMPVLASVGFPILNAAMFAPWLSIGVFLILLYLLSCLLRPATAFALAFLPTIAMLAAFYLRSGVKDRILMILFHRDNIFMINYMAIALLFGLFILYDISQKREDQLLKIGTVSNTTHRKMFHILAVLLYTPMHT